MWRYFRGVTPMRYCSPPKFKIRGDRMRSIVFTTALTTSILLAHVAPSTAAEPVACTVLTQTQIGAATGATMGDGKPIARPGTCQWFGTGKIVTLTINVPRAGKSPVDQFTE